MIRSMTAFQRTERDSPHGALTWELRSVNHRYLEVHLRLPEALRRLEPELRQHAAGRLRRGKLEATLRVSTDEGIAPESRIDWAAAHRWVEAARRLERRLGRGTGPGTGSFSAADLLRQPGVLQEPELDVPELRSAAATAFQEALDGLCAAREREGASLRAHLQARADEAKNEVAFLEQHREEANTALRQRTEARLRELHTPVDEGRLEQELTHLAQKMDIDEELARLRTHLDEIVRNLDAEEAVGRRLDFLMQELHREANTVSSKAGHVTLSRRAVELKVLIEQMREQIQNVE